MPSEVPDTAPREPQRIAVDPADAESFREWTEEGTGMAVGARVRDPDGRIALVKNSWSDGWILPGGTVELGESLREAARREVREETDLSATVGDPLIVLDQTYVVEAEVGGTEAVADDARTTFDAYYIVYAAQAEGTIPDAADLGETDDEIRAARWFESVPEHFHDDHLRPHL